MSERIAESVPVTDEFRKLDTPFDARDAPAAEAPGNRVGPYTLVRGLGQGGMGAVWLAEQTEPVKRQVALKLIRPGLGFDQVVARFGAERQALALMNHPNIAKFIDAGLA